MESAHRHDPFNEINAEKCSQAVPMISPDGYLDFNQWLIISLPPGGQRPISLSMFSLLQTPRLCPDRRPQEPASLSRLVSCRRKAFLALGPWMLLYNPFWGLRYIIKQITSEPIYTLLWFGKSSCQPLQWAMNNLEEDMVLQRAEDMDGSWMAGGCAEPFLIHSAIQLQLQVIFRYKQSKCKTD